MPTTPKGIVYPGSTEHTRMWDHLSALALSVDAAIDAAVPPGAWTAYTPAWTASTTNPVLGNGSIVGRYRLLGAKYVDFRIFVTMGSTTTYGSGAYSLSLPFQAHSSGRQVAIGDFTAGANTMGVRGKIEPSATTATLWVPGTTAGGYERAVTSTIPAGLATGHMLTLNGTYERL